MPNSNEHTATRVPIKIHDPRDGATLKEKGLHLRLAIGSSSCVWPEHSTDPDTRMRTSRTMRNEGTNSVSCGDKLVTVNAINRINRNKSPGNPLSRMHS